MARRSVLFNLKEVPGTDLCMLAFNYPLISLATYNCDELVQHFEAMG
jgi:hypothetical protein